MKRLLLILFKLMFVSLFIKAQTYAGRVTDKGGQPLVSASVVAKTNGGSVVAFARAGQDGRFSLIIPQGKEAKSIEVMMMGFGKVVIPLKDYKNGQTIKMQEQAVALKEVKVTPQRIRAEGDTLTYSVAGFKQKLSFPTSKRTRLVTPEKAEELLLFEAADIEGYNKLLSPGLTRFWVTDINGRIIKQIPKTAIPYELFHQNHKKKIKHIPARVNKK